MTTACRLCGGGLSERAGWCSSHSSCRCPPHLFEAPAARLPPPHVAVHLSSPAFPPVPILPCGIAAPFHLLLSSPSRHLYLQAQRTGGEGEGLEGRTGRAPSAMRGVAARTSGAQPTGGRGGVGREDPAPEDHISSPSRRATSPSCSPPPSPSRCAT
eukprot:350630-Chlamydomonas_euryale.AAC.4